MDAIIRQTVREEMRRSASLVSKSGFFGSEIVRLGYIRIITFIFITNCDPLIGATKLYEK